MNTHGRREMPKDGVQLASPRSTEGLAQLTQLLNTISTVVAADGHVSVEIKISFRLAYSVSALETETSVSRSSIYEAIADGSLVARRVGDRRTVIPFPDALNWLLTLPRVSRLLDKSPHDGSAMPVREPTKGNQVLAKKLQP